MNYLKKVRDIKNNILDIFISLLLPLVLFLPYFLSKDPQNLFWGDTAILYFPQFIEGKHLFSKGIFYGIDFLTNNGASAYFLRPNLPTFYPIYYIFYFLFPVENLNSLARVFVGIWYFHGVLATYFCIQFSKRHLRLGWQSSIFFAVLYFGAISRFSFFMPIFYYVAALFPMLICSTLYSVKATNKFSYLFCSIPYFLVLLSGYLPIDINAIIIALTYTSIYFFIINKKVINREFIGKFLKILAPFFIAATAVLPLYIAVLRYHNLVPGLPPGVWQAAHEHAYQSADILRIISSAFMQFRPQEEWPHVILGIIPIFILFLGCQLHGVIKINLKNKIVINLSLFIFLFYLVLSFGPYTGLSDIFYNLVPGLGKMHYYGRFLLVASFFLFAVVAIIFNQVLINRASIQYRNIIYFIIICAISIFFLDKYLNLNKNLDINSSLIIFELFLLSIVIFSLKSDYQAIPVSVIILFAFLIQAGDFNSPVSSFNAANPPPYVNTISNAPTRQTLLVDYFKTHSQKELIKYVDITDTVEKLEGLGPNYPWIAQSRIKISNYMGYELNSSVDKNYIELFPYYGRVNFPWILLTGADFIIYKRSQPTYSIELGDWIDKSIPQLDLGFNYIVAKLKTENGFLTGIPFGSGGEFNNGLIRAYSNSSNIKITNFKTDFSSKIDFEVSSPDSIIINYLLFPNKLMNLYVNGEKVSKNYNNGLLELKLPSGAFSVSYRYNSIFHRIFLYTYSGYFVVVFLSIIYLLFARFKDKLHFFKCFKYMRKK